ncbi:MAG: thiamine diphosphokinase [Bacteroidales bacterium]
MKERKPEAPGKTVIVANGSFPESPACLCFLKEADLVICCDGAADKVRAWGRDPDVIIGDLDSLSDDLRIRYADRLIHLADQESNDLTKAVQHCVSLGCSSAVILGATGMREDHTLGNISLLLTYLPLLDVRLESDYGSFCALRSGEVVSSRPGEQISLFSPDPTLRVSSSGLKYPLDRLQLRHWYTASLNEATGTRFVVEFDSEEPLLLYRARPSDPLPG